MWARIEPRRYDRQVHPLALIRVFVLAYLAHAPSLGAVLGQWGRRLRTVHPSTLSYALRRASSLGLAQAMLAEVQGAFAPRRAELVGLDSMPLTLPARRRHGCRPISRQTVGGGVLWAYRIRAAAGSCPVKILRLIVGPWHDTQLIGELPLQARGPVYLMDRGFWAIDRIAQWLAQGVHFIVRINAQDFCYTADGRCGAPRPAPRGVRIEFDGLATLGGRQRRRKPRVRLVLARLGDGRDLFLASDQFTASAEQLLEDYRQRWQMETFHRVLKDVLGLAHLYNFQERGIFFLMHVALLLVLLLFMGAARRAATTLQTIVRAIGAARRQLGVFKRWRRNMLATHQNRNHKQPPLCDLGPPPNH
jgi:hypothetical protein